MIEAVIVAAQTITVAAIGVIGVWIRSTKAGVKDAKEAVTNGHTSHLREDLDDMAAANRSDHAQVMLALSVQGSNMEGMARRIDTLSATVRTIEQENRSE